jgi:hypothetical protein
MVKPTVLHEEHHEMLDRRPGQRLPRRRQHVADGAVGLGRRQRVQRPLEPLEHLAAEPLCLGTGVGWAPHECQREQQ